MTRDADPNRDPDPTDPEDDLHRDLRRAEWMETSSLQGALASGGPLVLLAWPLARLAALLRTGVQRWRSPAER